MTNNGAATTNIEVSSDMKDPVIIPATPPKMMDPLEEEEDCDSIQGIGCDDEMSNSSGSYDYHDKRTPSV